MGRSPIAAFFYLSGNLRPFSARRRPILPEPCQQLPAFGRAAATKERQLPQYRIRDIKKLDYQNSLAKDLPPPYKFFPWNPTGSS
jgi:hypothetical protein